MLKLRQLGIFSIASSILQARCCPDYFTKSPVRVHVVNIRKLDMPLLHMPVHNPMPNKACLTVYLCFLFFPCVEVGLLPRLGCSGTQWHGFCCCSWYATFCLPALPGHSCVTVRDGKEERWLTPWLLLSSAAEKQCLLQLHSVKDTRGDETNCKIGWQHILPQIFLLMNCCTQFILWCLICHQFPAY